MKLYCANCGLQLTIRRKAIPVLGVIVDTVDFHECSEEPLSIDLKPIDITTRKPVEGKEKFVQKLNNLYPTKSTLNAEVGVEGKSFGQVSSFDLRDRRFESSELKSDIKTTAPSTILNMIDSMENGD